ncbi:MAG TPA: DUF805 domain-containing protein [Xanthobacteraceae bacterium]
MSFRQAIRSGFYNYVEFSGRAIRSEFWYWVLFTIIGGLLAATIDLALFADMDALSPLDDIFTLVTFLPGLAVAVRRLHDIDRSGWWFLLIFIPLVGAIVLIVFCCMRGSKGPNRFGADYFRPEAISASAQ